MYGCGISFCFFLSGWILHFRPSSSHQTDFKQDAAHRVTQLSPTYFSGYSLMSSIFPTKANSVRIWSFVTTGATFVTWITRVSNIATQFYSPNNIICNLTNFQRFLRSLVPGSCWSRSFCSFAGHSLRAREHNARKFRSFSQRQKVKSERQNEIFKHIKKIFISLEHIFFLSI